MHNSQMTALAVSIQILSHRWHRLHRWKGTKRCSSPSQPSHQIVIGQRKARTHSQFRPSVSSSVPSVASSTELTRLRKKVAVQVGASGRVPACPCLAQGLRRTLRRTPQAWTATGPPVAAATTSRALGGAPTRASSRRAATGGPVSVRRRAARAGGLRHRGRPRTWTVTILLEPNREECRAKAAWISRQGLPRGA